MIFHAPNTFLMYWTAKQLRQWWGEIAWRTRDAETKAIYAGSIVPTRAQTLAEFRRRRLPLRRRAR